MSAYNEAEKIIDRNFYTNPEIHRQRITRAQLQALLLADFKPMAKGNLWSIRWAHIGVGIYEIWLERN